MVGVLHLQLDFVTKGWYSKGKGESVRFGNKAEFLIGKSNSAVLALR